MWFCMLSNGTVQLGPANSKRSDGSARQHSSINCTSSEQYRYLIFHTPYPLLGLYDMSRTTCD